MGKLISLAQNIEDLYYQQYKTDDDFFELYHFKYLASITYSALLQQEFEKSYAKNLQEHGEGSADLNPEWFIHEELKIKRAQEIAPYEAQLSCRSAFSFRYDKQNSGIKDILPLNGRCGDFIRMSMDEKWKFDLLPTSSEIYWFPLGPKIYFSNIHCGASRATIIYIPAIDGMDDNVQIADGMQKTIIEETLNLMFTARNGKVIDTTNDGNANATLETEINDKFSKIRK